MEPKKGLFVVEVSGLNVVVDESQRTESETLKGVLLNGLRHIGPQDAFDPFELTNLSIAELIDRFPETQRPNRNQIGDELRDGRCRPTKESSLLSKLSTRRDLSMRFRSVLLPYFQTFENVETVSVAHGWRVLLALGLSSIWQTYFIASDGTTAVLLRSRFPMHKGVVLWSGRESDISSTEELLYWHLELYGYKRRFYIGRGPYIGAPKPELVKRLQRF